MSLVKEEYLICDRCKEKINQSWYKRQNLTRFKRKLIVSGLVHDGDFHLCGMCSEKFERFMDGKIDDDKPTEYERYYADKTREISEMSDICKETFGLEKDF